MESNILFANCDTTLNTVMFVGMYEHVKLNIINYIFVLISGLRVPYKEKHEVFDFDHLASKDPFVQFKCWFDEALGNDGIKEPNAVALATATKYLITFFIYKKM